MNTKYEALMKIINKHHDLLNEIDSFSIMNNNKTIELWDSEHYNYDIMNKEKCLKLSELFNELAQCMD